jgi:transcription termination factor NusA
VDFLIRHGFRSVREVADAEAYDLASILGVEESEAEAVIAAADETLDVLIGEETARRKATVNVALPDEA